MSTRIVPVVFYEHPSGQKIKLLASDAVVVGRALMEAGRKALEEFEAEHVRQRTR